MASVRPRGTRFAALYRDSAGKQRSAGSFDTAEEAVYRAKTAELAARPPEPEMLRPAAKRGKVTVAGFAPQWLDRQQLEPNSRSGYQSSLGHLVGSIGGKALAEVSPDDIWDVIRTMQKNNRADGTIRHMLTVARLLFQAAVTAGHCERNPCEIRYRVKSRRSMLIATREQARLIEEAAPERYRLLIRLLFQSGARWAEAIAVRGSDIEQRGSGYILKIQRTVNETRGVFTVKPYGKTDAAMRDITVPADLAADLMAFGDQTCFTNARGSYIRRSDFRSCVWVPAVRAAGLPALRVHDARHSHASWLASDPAVPLRAVRDRLGHSNLTITSRYVHAMPGEDDPCLKALGGA